LKSFVQQLSPQGEFFKGTPGPRISADPTISRHPALFLRRRDLKYGQAIDGILESLEEKADIPHAFWRFVGVEPEQAQGDGLEESQGSSPWSGLKDVIFTKPWNAEQLDIVKRLRRQSTVLVQGPPGTGKTHTIANLIGYLLANGQSVLVTAHTSKALKILRDKVVPELRPLCVSVLEDEAESKRQLEASVEVIVEHLSSDTTEGLELKAQKIEASRREILGHLSQAWQQLKEARSLEYRELVLLGLSYKPCEAAKMIQAGKGKHDWIPDALPPNTPCPLDFSEVCELYRLSATLTLKDEDEIQQAQAFLTNTDSGLQAFLKSDPFGLLASRVTEARLWASEPIDPQLLESFLEKLDRERVWLKDLQQGEPWRLRAIEAGLGGGSQMSDWKKLLEAIEEVYRTASSTEGGGLFSSFSVLLKKRRLERARMELARLWDELMAHSGLPSSAEILSRGVRLEEAVRPYGRLVRDSIEWFTQKWKPIQNELVVGGFSWEACFEKQPPKLVPFAGFERLCGAIEEARQELQAKCVALKRAQNCFHDLLQKKFQLERKKALFSRLEGVAPKWALMIRERQGIHANQNPPGDPKEAWLYGQLKAALDKRNQVSLDKLQEEIESLQAKLRNANTELAGARAWAARIKNTSLPQRQALVGWLDTVRRIGKGTGKRAPGLRKEAKKKMEECRQAVPVWIMPTSRVIETFNPKKTRFDVVIIDEASQCDLLGLCALFMADRAIIVGDDKQVSPLAIGSDVQSGERLISEHLGGIPNKDLYDGRNSVYNLARQSFGASISLLEHFRCVQDIISFSNMLCYGGKIKPLRDASEVKTVPFVVSYRLEGAFKEDKVNPKEAQAVASLLMAAIEQAEYQDATFGVISLMGDEQALEIDRLLRRYLSPETYRARRILCGNAAQFQGDERTVMFLSMVDAPQEGPLPLKTQDRDTQRFNVAASRACDQMWVVYSLDPKLDLKPGDLRRQLIEHALDPKAVQRASGVIEKRAESEFEKEVAQRLLAKGYNVHPQWEVGAYRIDLVVINKDGKKVAIECDGDRYHPLDMLDEDMARQAILERTGWRFLRIRGSVFYQDPDTTIDGVGEGLQRLGIMPFESLESPIVQESSRYDELKERIVLRAAKIRAEWDRDIDLTAPKPSMPSLKDKESPTMAEPAWQRIKEQKRSNQGLEEAGSRLVHPYTKKEEFIRSSEETPDPQAPSRLRLIKSRAENLAKKQADPLIETLESLYGLDWKCPTCHREGRIFIGRHGPFLSCGDSSCKQTVSLPIGILQKALETLNVQCPTCRAPMRAAFSKNGPFVGCTRYPACKTPMSWKDVRFSLKKQA